MNIADSEYSIASVYFAAANAAEDAIPESSRALIKRHDELHKAWSVQKWPLPVPAELTAASDAIWADPLARIPMDLRRQGNDAWAEAYRKMPTPLPSAPAA